jgi:hypothetical protein
MLNCYCQLSSSVIFRQYGVSQSECKIDRPRPGLPRVSPRPHTEALGTRLGYMFFIVIPLKNSKLKTLYPWRNPRSKPFSHDEFQPQNPVPLKNSKLKKTSISNLFTTEELQAQNLLPMKNSKLETLYPWRIPTQNPLSLKNRRIPGILDRGWGKGGGGTAIKWNSPIYVYGTRNILWKGNIGLNTNYKNPIIFQLNKHIKIREVK